MQYRVRAKLSQSDLAERAGVSRQAINKIEAGKAEPSASTLRAICVALDMDPNAVLCLRPQPKWVSQDLTYTVRTTVYELQDE